MEPDSQTFGSCAIWSIASCSCPKPAIVSAMRDIVIRERLIAEGAAATAVAAALHCGLPLAGRRVGIMLTGRNVDDGLR